MMFVPGPMNIVAPVAPPMQFIMDISTNSTRLDFLEALRLTGDFLTDQISFQPRISTLMLIVPFVTLIVAITFNIKTREWNEEERLEMKKRIKQPEKRGLKTWKSEASRNSDLEKAMGPAELEDYKELESIG